MATNLKLGTIRKVAKPFLWALVCWTAFAPVLALQWWRNSLQMARHPSLLTFFVLVLSIYVIFALLTPVLFWMVRRWPIKKPWVALRVAAYLVGGGIFVVIIPALRCIFLPPWDAYDQVFLPRNWETFYGLLSSRFADYTLGYVLIIAAAHAFEFHDRTRRQEIEQSELRRTLAESELQMLKTQLHPHFLFNTLQGISSLTQENPGLAKQMTIALGDLLRAALQHSSTDLIPLDSEIAFVNAYLDLEKMRLGERLQVRMDVSETARQCLVPQLLLQPLVENSIVHGIANTREGGWLEITSELNDEHLRLRLENSVAASANRGTGLGLRNTRSRLRNLYADDASLSFRITTRGTAEALIVIPVLRGSAAKCTAS